MYKRDLDRAGKMTKRATGKMMLGFKGMERGIGTAFSAVGRLRGRPVRVGRSNAGLLMKMPSGAAPKQEGRSGRNEDEPATAATLRQWLFLSPPLLRTTSQSNALKTGNPES